MSIFRTIHTPQEFKNIQRIRQYVINHNGIYNSNIQSASLSKSQWLSGWEDNHTPEVINLVIISLMRSKKPLSLQAGRFYTMSMQTFIAVRLIHQRTSSFTKISQIPNKDIVFCKQK